MVKSHTILSNKVKSHSNIVTIKSDIMRKGETSKDKKYKNELNRSYYIMSHILKVQAI